MAKKKRNILIVDDSPDDLEFYEELLKRVKADYFYMVYKATSLEAAKDVFAHHEISCTLVDYNMPEHDGLSVIAELQVLSANNVLPMLILTGEPHQKVQAAAARQGALDYVTKDSITSSQQIDKIITKVINWSNSLSKDSS